MLDAFIQKSQNQLQKIIGTHIIVSAVSGGVDSSTTTALIASSGLTVIPLLIDTGFLRENEVTQVCESFRASGMGEPTVLFAAPEFYASQKRAVTAEQKRLAFRQTYFDVLTKYLLQHNIHFLSQGTKSKPTANARLYHNYPTEAFTKLGVQLVEPLIGISKPDTRKLASKLGLLPELALRKSFPGPGLLIRFEGEYTPKKLAAIRSATLVVDTFVSQHEQASKNCFQIFPYLTDGLGAVTVKDGRVVTESILLLRAVRQVGENYLPFELPHGLREKLVQQLLSLPGIGRVCMDYSPKYGSYEHLHAGAPIEFQ